MIGSHFLFKRSRTAMLIKSSQVELVGGKVSKEYQILLISSSFCTKLSISCATGLKTGKIPSTNPEPYFHP